MVKPFLGCETGEPGRMSETLTSVFPNSPFVLTSFTPTFYPSILINNSISSFCFILPSTFIPVIQRMTIQEKGKKAVLGHGAWCQVLGLVCNFQRLDKDTDYSSAK
ncbi:hypothetical protein N335_07996, partial [Phaethon lepturus]